MLRAGALVDPCGACPFPICVMLGFLVSRLRDMPLSDRDIRSRDVKAIDRRVVSSTRWNTWTMSSTLCVHTSPLRMSQNAMSRIRMRILPGMPPMSARRTSRAHRRACTRSWARCRRA